MVPTIFLKSRFFLKSGFLKSRFHCSQKRFFFLWLYFQKIIHTYSTSVPRVLAGILSNALTTTAKFENLASSNWTCTIFEKLCRLSFVSIRPKLHMLVHNVVRFFLIEDSNINAYYIYSFYSLIIFRKSRLFIILSKS